MTVTFKPLLSDSPLLTPRAAAALASWLDSRPVSPDGRAVVGCLEHFRISPRETYSARAGTLVLGAQDCRAQRQLLWPVTFGEEPECLDHIIMDDVLSDAFASYRDTHFELAHVRTCAAITNSRMKLLTDQTGREAMVLHTAGASVYLDAEREPAELVYELRRDDPDPQAAEGLIHVHPHHPIRSNHERLALTARLEDLNRVIAAAWRGRKDAGATMPRPLEAGDLGKD